MTDIHPGLALCDLFEAKELHHADSLQDRSEKIQKLTDEITFINKLLSNIRAERKKSPEDEVDLSAYDEQLTRLRIICEECRDQNPEIFEPSDPVPFDEKCDFEHVDHDYLEWVENAISNIQTKSQSHIQTGMSHIETETLMMKQLVEIVSQIMKSLNDADTYYARKQSS